MDIEPYTTAIRTLFEATDLSDSVQSLQNYTAICVFAWQLEQALAEDGRGNIGHMSEQLAHFKEFLMNAVAPHATSHKSPEDWLRCASNTLDKVCTQYLEEA